jgi:uncharacterized protein YnzC (UPF0291/DUF896 family)
MVTKEQIERINILYQKQKAEGLTEEEKNEQSTLRKLYIESMKESLRSQLKNIKIVSPEEYEKTKGKEDCECEQCKNDHDHSHDCDHAHDFDHSHNHDENHSKDRN